MWMWLKLTVGGCEGREGRVGGLEWNFCGADRRVEGVDRRGSSPRRRCRWCCYNPNSDYERFGGSAMAHFREAGIQNIEAVGADGLAISLARQRALGVACWSSVR